MRLLCLSLWIGSIVIALAQDARLDDDAALQKPITLWMPLVALEEVLQEVSRQTGVSLRCQDALREVKVSVFVENGVAATLLENLAKLLGYRWRAREEGGYILYMPDATRRALEDALKQDRQATEQALREMLQRMREWLRLPRDKRAELLASANMDGAISAAESFEDFMLETGAHDRVQKPEDALRETLAQYLGGYVPRGEEAGTALSPFIDMGEGASLLHCLAETEESALRPLLEGRTIGFSTRPALGVFRLPDTVLLPASLRMHALSEMPNIDELYEQDPATNQFTAKRELPNPEFGGFWVRLSPWGDQLEYQFVGLGPSKMSKDTGGELQTHEDPLYLPVEAYWRQMEVWREWESWATPRREWSARLKDRRPLTRPKPQLNPEAPLLAARALEWIAWHTGYPVISDASRFVLAPYPNSLDNPRTLLALLSPNLWLRFDESGYLLARHKRFWMLSQFEIPERLVRPAEAKWLRGEWLTLDDLAPIAGYLNETQTRGFFSGRRRSIQQFWTAFDNGYLYYGLLALRFWASLGGVQRTQAQSGEWIPESALTLPQRARFRDALNGGFPPPERLFLNLPADYNRYLPGERIYATASPSEAPPQSLGLDDLNTALQRAPSQPAFRLAARPLHREVEILWKPSDAEYWMRTSFTLRETDSEASLTPDALRQRLGKDGTIHTATMRSQVIFYMEFFAPPRQYERYLIPQSREEALLRSQEP